MKNRSDMEKRLNLARSNLLVVIIFSAINIALVLLNTNITFLFTATCPTLIVQIGQLASEEARNSTILWIAGAISAVIVLLYTMCYFLSKKRGVFMMIALILFTIDTLVLVWLLTLGFDSSVLFDIAFHIWVLYYLIVGTKAWLNLKKMPFEDPLNVYYESSATHASPLRVASAHGKTILSQTYGDLEITVKRSFDTTELIVNGLVYAEQAGLAEPIYTLEVCIEDTYIRVTKDHSGDVELYVNENLLRRVQNPL